MTTSPGEPSLHPPEPGHGGFRARLRQGGRRFWTTLTGGAQTPIRTSLALGLGIFVAVALPPGIQTPIVLGLALLLRLNGIVAFAGTLVSQPFTVPFILFLEHRVGLWLLRSSAPAPPVPGGVWSPWVKPLLVGAPVTGAAAGLLGALLCFLLLIAWRRVRGIPPAPPGDSP